MTNHRRPDPNRIIKRRPEKMPTDRDTGGRFPTGKWALVQRTRDGHPTYGTAWLVTYRGDIPVLSADPGSACVDLPAAAGQILSTHTYREAAAGRAELLNRPLTATEGAA